MRRRHAANPRGRFAYLGTELDQFRGSWACNMTNYGCPIPISVPPIIGNGKQQSVLLCVRSTPIFDLTGHAYGARSRGACSTCYVTCEPRYQVQWFSASDTAKDGDFLPHMSDLISKIEVQYLLIPKFLKSIADRSFGTQDIRFGQVVT